MYGITKVGTLRISENEFSLQRYLTRCGLLRQRNDFWTLVQMMHVMTTSQSDTKCSDDTVPMAQEPSFGSGVKRSNIEAIRRADAEAEKALQLARLLEARRAAKKASATLEEMDTMLVAAEAVLTRNA